MNTLVKIGRGYITGQTSRQNRGVLRKSYFLGILPPGNEFPISDSFTLLTVFLFFASIFYL